MLAACTVGNPGVTTASSVSELTSGQHCENSAVAENPTYTQAPRIWNCIVHGSAVWSPRSPHPGSCSALRPQGGQATQGSWDSWSWAVSRAQVRPRWSRSPVYDQTLEESIGLFTFDLGIEKN